MASIATTDFAVALGWAMLSPLPPTQQESDMKALAEKIKETFGRKQGTAPAPVEHPNFWMYQ